MYSIFVELVPGANLYNSVFFTGYILVAVGGGTNVGEQVALAGGRQEGHRRDRVRMSVRTQRKDRR